MPLLVGCPGCRIFVRADETRCPECGTAFTVIQRGPTIAVAMLGVVLAGCGDGSNTSSDDPSLGSAYGVPETTNEDTGPSPTTTAPTTTSSESSDAETSSEDGSSASSDSSETTGADTTGATDDGSTGSSGDGSSTSGG